MIKSILSYRYSELDKTHCYYVLAGAMYNWVWFYIGKNLKAAGANFRLYPFPDNNAKVILDAKINDGKKQGEMIAKKINKHYLSKSKKRTTQ
jgi:hypothetical protein